MSDRSAGASCLRVALSFTLLLSALSCNDSGGQQGEAGEAQAAAEPQAAALVRVQTQPVRKAMLESRNRASGIARAFHNAKVTAETQGRVLRRHAETGDRVEAGQLLVELDGSRLALEVRRAEATLRARANDLAHAQREHERGEQLEARNAISSQQRDELQHSLDSARDQKSLAQVARDTAKRNLQDARISAPFAGVVDELFVDVGDYVAPGTMVVRVVDLSRARLFAGVTAQQAAVLGGNSEATVRFPALGGRQVVAQLKSVARSANERDGTYPVELWLDDPPEDLRDGMVASVDLPSVDQAAQPLAPRAALMRRDGQPEIYVVERRGQEAVARLRSLRTGRSEGDWIEVLEGLEAGDEVIVEGQFALRDGTPIVVDTNAN